MSNSKQLLSRFCVAALAGLAAIASPHTVRADSDDLAFSATLANGAYYTVDHWQPVRVQISNRTTSVMTGEVVLPFEGRDEKVSFHLPLTIQPKSRILTTAFVYIPAPAEAPANQKLAGGGKQLCVAEWRNQGGAMLSRCPILGHPVTDLAMASNADPIDGVRIDSPFFFTLLDPRAQETNQNSPVHESAVLAGMFQTPDDGAVRNIDSPIDAAPRDVLAYDSVAAVILDADAGQLDPAQQQAFIDFMTTGGTVVLAGQQGDTDPFLTWMAPYLPARRIGTHYDNAISGQLGGTLRTIKTIAPIDLCEWAADPAIPDVRIVLADKNYVHAAYRQVGLGRFVVTSFPISALDVKDPIARDLWEQLIPSPLGVSVENSALEATQSQMLESMVGLKVPPWIVAATVVSIYVGLILAIQLVARQGFRPLGFTAAVGLAILIAGGLLVVSLFRDRTIDLSMARIDVLDLDRGGVRHEAASLLGPDGMTVALAAAPGSSLRQAPSPDNKPLKLAINPIASRDAAVYPRRIERVWQSSAPVPASQTLHAAGRFSERGLSLTIDNTVGPLEGATVVGQRGRFAVPDITTGASTVEARDGGSAGGVQLQSAQLRGRILNAALTSTVPTVMHRSSSSDAIYLAGWLNAAPPALMQFAANQSPKVEQSNVLVRTRVDLQASPVGSSVYIPRAFTQMVGSGGTLGPYDPVHREWIDAFSSQEFLVGFRYPMAIGKLQPARVHFDLQADAPQQTITIRRGQCTSGKPVNNPTGPIVGQWQGLSSTSADFEVAAGDTDVNGWVWVLVTVDSPVEQSKWRMKDLAMTYDGQIVGPPQKALLPEPPPLVSEPVTPQPAKKPPAKKPAEKKPTEKKPAEKKPTEKKPTTPKPAPPPKKKPANPQASAGSSVRNPESSTSLQ